jgi:hypothetical protein
MGRTSQDKQKRWSLIVSELEEYHKGRRAHCKTLAALARHIFLTFQIDVSFQTLLKEVYELNS